MAIQHDMHVHMNRVHVLCVHTQVYVYVTTMHTHTYTHIHTQGVFMYANICTQNLSYTHTWMCIYIYTHYNNYVHVCMYVRVHVVI